MRQECYLENRDPDAFNRINKARIEAFFNAETSRLFLLGGDPNIRKNINSAICLDNPADAAYEQQLEAQEVLVQSQIQEWQRKYDGKDLESRRRFTLKRKQEQTLGSESGIQSSIIPITPIVATPRAKRRRREARVYSPANSELDLEPHVIEGETDLNQDEGIWVGQEMRFIRPTQDPDLISIKRQPKPRALTRSDLMNNISSPIMVAESDKIINLMNPLSKVADRPKGKKGESVIKGRTARKNRRWKRVAKRFKRAIFFWKYCRISRLRDRHGVIGIKCYVVDD